MIKGLKRKVEYLTRGQIPYLSFYYDEGNNLITWCQAPGSILEASHKIKCKAYLTLNAKLAILKMISKLCKGVESVKTKIPELRKHHKLSQEELAAAVGVTRQTITSLECGKYTASLILAYKIARYFGLTIEEVFDFSGVEEF